MLWMMILMMRNTFDDLYMCQLMFHMLMMMLPSLSPDDVVLGYVCIIPFLLRGGVEIL
jgi:hypothetical protein